MCDYLLFNDADSNFALECSGETPLHAAICKPSTENFESIVELLLSAGAIPNVKTLPGSDTGAFMRDCRTRQETPLHRAAAFGSEKVINALLEAGAKRETQDMNGDLPLSWASWYLRPRSILAKLCYGDFKVSIN